ncbi:MAG: HupE/UreJ family protein [Sporichthyaceae bacterium]
MPVLQTRAVPRILRCSLVLVVVLVAHFVAAGPVAAHGIGGDLSDKSVPDFVPIGIEHMLLGWDHLLFIVAVVVLAGRPRRAAKFISLFALGHSITLIVATLAEWRISPTIVDVVIALSIVYVGIVGVRGQPYHWRAFGAGVFAFGLVHGLGLSTRFQDLGLPDDGQVGRLIAFNVGIEIGQLMAIVLVVLLGLLILDVTKRREQARQPQVLRGVNVAVIAAGLVGAGVVSAQADGGDPYEDLGAPADAGCTVAKVEAPLVYEGGHPEQNFYEPGEKYADQDFGHVVGDGFVVIRYRQSLPSADWYPVRDYVGRTQGVVAGPVTDQANAVEITTQSRTLRCAGMDPATVVKFGDLWLSEQRR